jgi:hypothetical protein
MYYLKCDNCGHLNPLKSEYVTFCDHCGKKLKDNFGSWKGERPDGTFEQFRGEFAISGNEAQVAKRSFRRKNSNVKKIVVISVAIVAGLVVAAFAGRLGEKVARSFKETRAPKEWLTSSWKTFSPFPGRDLVMETPVTLLPKKQPMTPEMTAYLSSMVLYENKESDGMRISVATSTYKEGIVPNLENAAKGAVAAIEGRPETTQFDHNTEEITLEGGQKAILQKGSYVYKSSFAAQFVMLTTINGSEMYQVIIAYGAADDTGSEIADRIIRSIKMKS